MKIPSEGMKTISLFIVIFIFSINLFSQTPGWSWAIGIGGTDDDAGLSVTCDSCGNSYTAGSFQQTVDFDPGAGTFNLTSAGGDDIFISKTDSAGNFIWAKKIGGAGFDLCRSIITDASRNIYAAGEFTGTVDFDAGVGIFNLAGGGHFILKLDSSGNFVWAKAIAGTAGYSIALDASANVYTTGYFSGTIDFNPNAGTVFLSSHGSTDFFILKLDSAGNFAWAKGLGGSGNDDAWSISLDRSESGDVYSTGIFMDTVDFDPGAGIFNLISGGNSSIFIIKLSSNGDFIWAKEMGGVTTDYSGGLSIAVSPSGSGSIYTTGFFGGTDDFDPGAGTFNLIALGDNDIFISKLDSSGNFVWAKKMGGVNNDVGLALTVDASENVYTSGFFEGTGDFDPGAGFYDLTSAGNHDIFVSKLDSSGNFVWAKAMGGSFDDNGHSIAVDVNGAVRVTGDFYSSSVFFDSTNLINASAGNSDIFIASLDDHFTTGNIESENFGRGILLFPNPAASEVNLMSGNVMHGTIQLSNALGEVLEMTQINSSAFTIHFDDKPSGLYFITLTDAAGNKVVSKIMKQ
jgi:hypothetical protein